MDSYIAKYADLKGSEDIIITNDGETLKTKIRGVTFSGEDFDSLEPDADTNQKQLAKFTLNRNDLCSCTIQCEIPILVNNAGKSVQAELSMELTLGEPASNGAIDSESLQLTLLVDGREFKSSGSSGWFEDDLLEIQAQLPTGIYMQICFNCLYSDYSPYGHGLFGCMMCFKNLKLKYLKVTSKEDFWAVHDGYDSLVQETSLCQDFKRRVTGTGYRG